MSKYSTSLCAIRWILILLLTQSPFSTSLSQSCSLESLYDDVIVIRDESSVTVRIRVENARFNDLSEGFQGLCGVRLNFRHNNLSDLVMTLTSPYGNSVTLIGPASKNGTNPSPIIGIDHDIRFVPSTTFAVPDMDLPVEWTNENINWGSNPPYIGSYFPFNGDFITQFKEGTLNGIWELTIEDAFINDVGILRAFELEFCEASDVSCSACESRSGEFMSEDAAMCSGSSYDYLNEYVSDNFDSSKYQDQILIYSEDVLISYDTLVDFSLLSSGDYYLYGINVDLNDIDSIKMDLEGLTRGDMEAYIDNPGGLYCLSRSESQLLQINEPGDTIRLERIVLCDDSFEVFRGDTIRTTGEYITVSEACDSILLLPVIKGSLEVAPLRDTAFIDCNLGGVTLFVEASSNDLITYNWTDLSGTTLSQDSFMFQTFADVISVSVDDGICNRDFQIIVLHPSDTMDINISTTASGLDCMNETSLASITSNFEILEYTWWSFDSIIGTSESVVLSETGVYIVEVQGVNGCTKRDSISIIDRRRTPDVMLLLDTINCPNRTATIDLISLEPLSVVWNDAQSNIIGDSSSINIQNAGDYSVNLINDAFCDTSIVFSVIVDTIPIRIANVPNEGLLNCETSVIDVSPSFLNGTLESVTWSNEFEPNLSEEGNFRIDQAASYQLVAVAENGCVDTADLLVTIDTVAPLVTLSGGELTCLSPTITVEAITDNVDILYAWTGPYDARLSDASIRVSIPGVYTVGVLDTISECITIDTISIMTNNEAPMINIVGESVLNCLNSEILVFNSIEGLVNPVWRTPDGEGILSDSILIREEGDYVFSATSPNGCSTSIIYRVVEDMDTEPLVIPDSVFLNCVTPIVNLAPTLPSSVRQLEWIINADTIRAGTYLVNSSGILFLDVLYFNGCRQQYEITVIEDLTSPNVNILNDTIDCATPVITLELENPNENYRYSWMGNYDGRGDTSFVLVSTPEIITVSVEDIRNGCTASRSVTVLDQTEVFEPTIFRTVALECDIPIGRIDVSADQPISVVWTDPDSAVYTSAQGVVDKAGRYSIYVIADNKCDFFTEWDVEDNRVPANAMLDSLYTFSCDQTELLISPSSLDPNSIVNWIYSNGDTIQSAEQNVSMDTQLESLYVVDEDQCDTIIPLNFNLDTSTLQANILMQDSTDCNGDDVEIMAADPSGMFEVLWTQDGSVVSNSGLSLTASSSGVYKIEIRNTENGCISSDVVQLRISDMPIVGGEFELESEICLGDMSGSFVLRNIEGGNGNTFALFNGQEITLNQDVFGLSQGAYNLEIEDEFGCQWDTILSVNPGIDYNIDLGNDITVNRGEFMSIHPDYEGSQPNINIYRPVDIVREIDFDTLILSPSKSEILSVISTSLEGCISSDSLFINFNNNLDGISLYVPNVFKPSNLSINNAIHLELPDDIISVDFFKIFDRWGQEIVSLSNLVSPSPILVWDGTYEGENVVAGVYVYAYQITTIIDGIQKFGSGDITVIR